MITKEEVDRLYYRVHNYSEVARILGVTKQRVHQVAKGYRTISRNDFYLKHLKPICEECKSQNSTELHHVDGTTTNNTARNLKSVCKRCHMKLDVLRRWGKRCKRCKQMFFKQIKHYCKGMCKLCFDHWRGNHSTNNQRCKDITCPWHKAIQCTGCGRQLLFGAQYKEIRKQNLSETAESRFYPSKRFRSKYALHIANGMCAYCLKR